MISRTSFGLLLFATVLSFVGCGGGSTTTFEFKNSSEEEIVVTNVNPIKFGWKKDGKDLEVKLVPKSKENGVQYTHTIEGEVLAPSLTVYSRKPDGNEYDVKTWKYETGKLHKSRSAHLVFDYQGKGNWTVETK